MARPLRIEFPGAVYHVTSRGDRGEPIFVDDEDRQSLLGVVAQALSRFDAEALSYCLMGNHSHFMLHTRQAVPRPRLHLIRSHGVLAPHAKLRAQIVPSVPVSVPETCDHHAQSPP